MGRQKGLIRLEGNIGGISFYSSEGKDLARLANGPSKDRIAKDPAFKRTRENNMEFGGSAKIAKSFRNALGSVLQSMAGSRLTSRLTKAFKAINLKSSGVRGRRPIQLSTNKDDLKNFNMDKKLSFSTVFSAPYTYSHDPDRNEGTVEVANFIPADFINAPSGATHFRLVTALGAVSDYIFNDSIGGYEPNNPGQDGLSAVGYSPMTALGNSSTNFSLTAAFNGAPTIDSDISVLQTMGVEFYQEVDGEYYLFAQDNAMKVINVF